MPTGPLRIVFQPSETESPSKISNMQRSASAMLKTATEIVKKTTRLHARVLLDHLHGAGKVFLPAAPALVVRGPSSPMLPVAARVVSMGLIYMMNDYVRCTGHGLPDVPGRDTKNRCASPFVAVPLCCGVSRKTKRKTTFFRGPSTTDNGFTDSILYKHLQSPTSSQHPNKRPIVGSSPTTGAYQHMQVMFHIHVYPTNNPRDKAIWPRWVVIDKASPALVSAMLSLERTGRQGACCGCW